MPDRRLESEAALVERVGAWIGGRVLGEAVVRALVDESPVVVVVVVVQVTLPLEADFLLHCPLS